MKSKNESKFSRVLLALMVTCAVVLAFASVPDAKAAGNFFSETGTAVSTNYSYAVIPAANSAAVEYVHAISDSSTGAVLFASASAAPLYVNNSSGGGTNKVYVKDNPIGTVATNTYVLLRHKSADTYERVLVVATNSTSITLGSASSSAVAVGDEVWVMGTPLALPVGDANKEYAPPQPLYNVAPGGPAIVAVTGRGTNTVRLNVVSGRLNRN